MAPKLKGGVSKSLKEKRCIGVIKRSNADLYSTSSIDFFEVPLEFRVQSNTMEDYRNKVYEN